MEITNVQLIPILEGRLRGFVNVTFDDCFVVRGVKIIEGKGRLFVAMPARRREDGTHQDIAHPITLQFRKALEEAILKEYHRRLLEGGVPPDPGQRGIDPRKPGFGEEP